MEKLVVATSQLPDPAFWRGKHVLLTGHSGFKGSWLTLWLNRLGATVTGISLPPTTTPNLYGCAEIAGICDSHFCDIRDADKLAQLVGSTNFDIAFHLAAQPLVRASYAKPIETFDTNILGTANLLEALRSQPDLRVAVMITTDKVYRNMESSRPYEEDDTLGGHDPYSASKAASEIVIASYRDAFLSENGTAVASARAGNVIGGGDWSDDRLFPDVVRAWQSGETLEIRRPDAVRPWQHVLEPLAGYLKLTEKLWREPEYAGAYNFGPNLEEVASVRDVIALAQNAYGEGDIHLGEGVDGVHEAGILSLGTAKAFDILGFEPRWSLNESIQRTMDWYRKQYEGVNAITLCDAEIRAYENSCSQAVS